MARTRLAHAIATIEGFFKDESKPMRFHNPGDLRHSPHSVHTPDNPDGIGIIDTDAHGWSDLERQLQLFAARGLTLERLVNIYAPESENDSDNYLHFLCSDLGCEPSALVSELLKQTV